MRWAAFLDRDGVLTESVAGDASPLTAADLYVLPGAVESVALLHDLGAVVLVVTNQPDVARGRLPVAELEAMHERLVGELGVDGVRACPHDGAAECRCRKPAPGLLEDLAAEHGVTLGDSWMVGDRWVDIAAGRAAGTHTVLVERPGSWAATSSGVPPGDLQPDVVVTDVLEAARHIAAVRGSPAAGWSGSSVDEVGRLL